MCKRKVKRKKISDKELDRVIRASLLASGQDGNEAEMLAEVREYFGKEKKQRGRKQS